MTPCTEMDPDSDADYTTCRFCAERIPMEAVRCAHCGAHLRPVDGIPPCPKCGSPEVQRAGPGYWGLVCFLSGGCAIWIPIIGWVLAPFFFVAALVLWIAALVPGRERLSFQCQKCKCVFTVPKKELQA